MLPDESFTVVTTSFIAAGKDGYNEFAENDFVNSFTEVSRFPATENAEDEATAYKGVKHVDHLASVSIDSKPHHFQYSQGLIDYATNIGVLVDLPLDDYSTKFYIPPTN